MTAKEVVTTTPTAQRRAERLPAHRSKAQIKQTLWGILFAVAGCALVYLVGATQVWYLVSVLVGMRIASRDFLMDCLGIARDIVTFRKSNG